MDEKKQKNAINQQKICSETPKTAKIERVNWDTTIPKEVQTIRKQQKTHLPQISQKHWYKL